MKPQFLFFILCITINGIFSDCGCLKCSKHLEVVSPPYLPYKVIVNHRGSPCDYNGQNQGTYGYYQQNRPATYIPIKAKDLEYDYRNVINSPCPPVYAYKYQLQAPVIVPPPLPPPVTGLVARPDRIVVQNPTSINCPVYTGDDGSCDCDEKSRPYCRSIFENGFYGTPVQIQPYQSSSTPPSVVVYGNDEKYNTPSILEPINTDCGCRYEHRRKKRELPILRKSVQFLMELIPFLLQFPFDKYYHSKPSESFLRKLQKLNGREKRSLVFDNDRIRLPFLKVTDIENHIESESEEDSEEYNGDKKEEYLRPLNFNHLVPHSPIFYLLNAPIRFLHQFHKFGQQISPVFKSVPYILINSKKYLRHFGRNLKNDVLNFASEIIGDFDEMDAHSHRYIKPRRYKRNVEKLEQFEPEYSLVFQNQTENSRRKRYILKVVDEDEVEKFLREKLEILTEPKTKQEKESKKKRLVVERLAPKIIVDNNGRTFVEINGIKRPLFFNRKTQVIEEKKEEKKEEDETTEDMKEKINLIITKAREKIGQNPTSSAVPNQMIKDRINQVLTEIQNLINLDLDKYSTIHSNLYKLQSFKELLVVEWKKIINEEKMNDISSKIHLLNEFKEMQILKDKCVEAIASILKSDSTFMMKKLIKILVRLQKLQCIIYRVVEDFDEKIKMNTEFDNRKESKYAEFLNNLHFVIGRTQHDLENDLKHERDVALENELKVLENLRKLEEGNYDSLKVYEEAQLLWEIKNIDKLQKDAISEMNEKISRGQKVRKELKILFDLLRQLENCEQKQRKLFDEFGKNLKDKSEKKKESNEENDEIERSRQTNHNRNRIFRINLNRNKNFPHKTIIEDKKPIRLVSNGYSMTAYKVSDGFD